MTTTTANITTKSNARIVADNGTAPAYDGNNELHVRLACIRNGLAAALHANPAASEEIQHAREALEALMVQARMR